MNDSRQSPLTRSSERVTKLIGAATIGMALWVSVSVYNILQPDICAAVTVYPNWCWFVGGLFLAPILFKTKSRWMTLISIGLWFVFLIGFADTPLSIWRELLDTTDSEWVAARRDQQALRVISLNCSKQSILALKQKIPDLILE